jgi:hypothetical protein
MDEYQIQLINVTTILTVLAVLLTFAYVWFKRQERFRLEEFNLRKQELEMQRYALATRNLGNSGGDSDEQSQKIRSGQGGYIVLDLPDEQKSMFHDVLKGFEEFAQIRGYGISFSIDGSIPDKIAFKFTLSSAGIRVSTSQVEDDLKDYIDRVKRGDALDDLPEIIPEAKHAALLLAMRNRINFLQHTYTAQQNAMQFYERLLKDGKYSSMGILPAQTFYLQSGGGMSNSNYTAIDSQNVAQGKNNEASGNTIDQSVHIGQSFNEKREQIEALDCLIAALRSTEHTDSTETKRAVVNLEKVKDEVANEEKPDDGRVKKWLETAKGALETTVLGKEVYELAAKVFTLFYITL